MFRDLAEDFAGKPGEVLCGAARIAVTRQLRCFLLELVLAVGGGGQRGAGQRRSQVGQLADGTGKVRQDHGVVLAE
jgi:hypothetical protein